MALLSDYHAIVSSQDMATQGMQIAWPIADKGGWSVRDAFFPKRKLLKMMLAEQLKTWQDLEPLVPKLLVTDQEYLEDEASPGSPSVRNFSVSRETTEIQRAVSEKNGRVLVLSAYIHILWLRAICTHMTGVGKGWTPGGGRLGFAIQRSTGPNIWTNV